MISLDNDEYYQKCFTAHILSKVVSLMGIIIISILPFETRVWKGIVFFINVIEIIMSS